MTVKAMLLAFGFSVCVGILTGIIPAFNAARLNPIQTSRVTKFAKRRPSP